MLQKEGVTDLTQYAFDPSNVNNLMPDFFLDDVPVPSTSATSTKPVTSEPVGEVAKLFKAIETNLSPDSVAKTQAVFAFVVTGDEAGKW